nr:arginase family protein [Brevibacillus fulvus]
MNFDGTLKRQKRLTCYAGEWIDFSDLSSTQGYCAPSSLQKIQRRLQNRKNKGITFIGNGNYHYVTYLLLAELNQPFSLLLFDHHSDLSPMDDLSIISCGSWVSFALKTLPMLQRVVIIGAHSQAKQIVQTSPKVTIISEQEINQWQLATVEARLRLLLQNEPVYISVDKDVLDEKSAVTNWDQGSMNLRQLLYLIRDLRQSNAILGVDVCGELPLSPLDFFSVEVIEQIQKNERANRAIVEVISAS